MFLKQYHIFRNGAGTSGFCKAFDVSICNSLQCKKCNSNIVYNVYSDNDFFLNLGGMRIFEITESIYSSFYPIDFT